MGSLDSARGQGLLSDGCSVMSASYVQVVLQVSDVHPRAVQSVLLDLPGLLFFTTYTLLVLFWAEIYHQVGVPSASTSSQ